MENPLEGYETLYVDKRISDAIDPLVNFANKKGCYSGRIENKNDWDLVEEIYLWWEKFCPEDAIRFKKKMKELKKALLNEFGSAKESGGAEVRHTLEMPKAFDQLLITFFPQQKYDSLFVAKLCRKLPLFKVPEKL